MLARDSDEEGGFVLLESLVTIALITVIMTALTTFFITAMSSTSRQRSEQSATQIANSAMETVRGYGAQRAVSDRDSASVNGQFSSALAGSTRMTPWLGEMSAAVDTGAAAGRGARAPLPTTPQVQVVNGINYEVNYFVGSCWRSGADSSDDVCRKVKTSALASPISYLRVVVGVTWPDKTCPDQTCLYVTQSLLNPVPEPTFNFRSATPPLPSLKCADQVSAVGEQLTSRSVLASDGPPKVPGCTPSGGIPTFTYEATDLPDGLTMAGDGTVSGAATTQNDRQVTITVTDGFLRKANATFTWQVLPPLVITAPGEQTSTYNVGIPTLALAATGGAGAPFTWSASGLPPGLSINKANGRITGTPTAVGAYPITLTVADQSTTRTSTATLRWVVVYAPLQVTPPGDQITQIGTQANLTLASSGGSGNVTWTVAGGSLPPGLSLQGNRIVGTASTVTLKRAVTLRATDTAAGVPANPTDIGLVWTVDNGDLAATVQVPPSTVGQAIDFTGQVSGGTAPYTWSGASGLPSGTSLAANGRITGTPSAPGTYPVSATVSDAGGRTKQVSFSWVVNPRPSLTTPDSTTFPRNTKMSVDLRPVCGTTPCVVKLSAGTLPPGLTLNPSTGVVQGTPTVNGRFDGLVFTITDAAGATSSTDAVTWWTSNLTLTPPQTLSTPKPQCGNSCTYYYSPYLQLTPLASGGTGPYTFEFLSLSSGDGGQTNSGKTQVRVYTTRPSGQVVLRTQVTDSTGASAVVDIVWTIQ